jgi:hypothetical protein
MTHYGVNYEIYCYINNQEMNMDFYQCACTAPEEGRKLLENMQEINPDDVIHWRAQL